MFTNAYSPYANGASKTYHTGERDINEYMTNEVAKNGGRVGPETGMSVPHVISFASIVGTASATYWHSRFDEAIRDSQGNADAMRNDPFVRRLMDERKYAVCSLNSSIEVDNERDPWQKALKDGLTQMWKALPRSIDLHWYLLEADWYGRYGAQFIWHRKMMDLPALPKLGGAAPGLPAILGAPGGREKRPVLALKNHIPYEGDKIGYDYWGCPYVLVSAMAATSLHQQGAEVNNIPDIHAKSMEYGYTTAGGKALFLRTPSWRQRFAIHTGEILDGPFLDAEKGDQIHGIGIRSVIYWYWWLRDEFLSNVTDWCARTGLGVRIWYYDAGNPASEAAIDKAARDQDDKVNIKIPRTPGQDPAEGVEFVDTTGTGANLLLEIVRWVEEHIELYVVGQSMSKGSDESNGSGFGDRGRTQFAQSTKLQITKRSAAKYGDTCTTDILDVMKRWSFPPEMQEIPARVVFNVDVPDPDKFMKAVTAFCDMGGVVQESQARNTLGLADVHEGDKVLGGQKPLPPGMGGGGVPGEGGEIKPGGKENEPKLPQGEKKSVGAGAGTMANGRVAPENGHVNGKARFEMPPEETVEQNTHE
jgi:hypothetical protein